MVAHAADDTSRLAYADWLDENGDPDRAAFIRVLCAVATRTPADPDRVDLDIRRVDLTNVLRRRTDFDPPPPAVVGVRPLRRAGNDGPVTRA